VPRGLTPWLTGAGSRRLEGTNIGHENAEGMAYVGVRVEPTVRLVTDAERVELLIVLCFSLKL
jgi:hypothetical protein